MPLRLHTITFTTTPQSKDLHVRAACWNFLVQVPRITACFCQCPQRMDDAMVEEVKRRFHDPVFLDEFFWFRANGYARKIPYHDSPSLHRDQKRQVLQLAITDPAIREYFAKTHWPPGSRQHLPRQECDVDLLVDLDREPWRIPAKDELDHLLASIPDMRRGEETWSQTFTSWEFWESDWERFRFSAAAAAIRFLNSLPASQRQNLRKLMIHEDRPSVAYPECHVRGLAPFCVENPALRVERRVGLWQNLFLSAGRRHLRHMERDRRMTALYSGIYHRQVAETVVDWMSETSSDSISSAITLFFDGGPIPDVTATVFDETVQRTLCWRIALERVHGRQAALDRPTIYLTHALPRLVHELCANEPSSRFRCNFDPGQPWGESEIQHVMQLCADTEPVFWPQKLGFDQELGRRERRLNQDSGDPGGVWWEPKPPLPSTFKLLKMICYSRKPESRFP